MKKKLVTTFTALLLVGAAPSLAAGFGIFGSYYDADTDETGGGGISFSFPVAQTLDIKFRGTYYEQLSDDPFERAFDDEFFKRGSLEIIPIEAGVKWNFLPGGTVGPYLGGGGTYFLLDHENDAIDVDDEVGYYVEIGARFGQPRGINFFVEALYRDAEASVEPGTDPSELDDIDDIDFIDAVDVDLSGPAVNAGVVWTF